MSLRTNSRTSYSLTIQPEPALLAPEPAPDVLELDFPPQIDQRVSRLTAPGRYGHNVAGRAVGWLVGSITRRSGVQIRPPSATTTSHPDRSERRMALSWGASHTRSDRAGHVRGAARATANGPATVVRVAACWGRPSAAVSLWMRASLLVLARPSSVACLTEGRQGERLVISQGAEDNHALHLRLGFLQRQQQSAQRLGELPGIREISDNASPKGSSKNLSLRLRADKWP